VTRSVPQLLSLTAIAAGVLLFVFTLFHIDAAETVASARRLGFALPIILLPGTAWQLLRTWGWSVAFPDDARPSFTRLFRVRLAADAISYFTVRGIAGEPLKVVLLYDRSQPQVATAAIALERLAFAIGGIVIAGLVSAFAVTKLALAGTWDVVFRLLSIGAVLTVWLVVWIARHRSSDYLARLVMFLDRLTGRRLEASRVVRFILDVEHVLLALLRGDRRRLIALSILPIVCYLMMSIEVWLVFWAIDQPIGITQGLADETFARLASIASAPIPGSMGALEASNAAVVDGLGLAGGGALALTRRIRSLLWAGLGLALYPRIETPPPSGSRTAPGRYEG
jgi:uncharacterized protein (TIRG00374 family)